MHINLDVVDLYKWRHLERSKCKHQCKMSTRSFLYLSSCCHRIVQNLWIISLNLPSVIYLMKWDSSVDTVIRISIPIFSIRSDSMHTIFRRPCVYVSEWYIPGLCPWSVVSKLDIVFESISPCLHSYLDTPKVPWAQDMDNLSQQFWS